MPLSPCNSARPSAAITRRIWMSAGRKAYRVVQHSGDALRTERPVCRVRRFLYGNARVPLTARSACPLHMYSRSSVSARPCSHGRGAAFCAAATHARCTRLLHISAAHFCSSAQLGQLVCPLRGRVDCVDERCPHTRLLQLMHTRNGGACGVDRGGSTWLNGHNCPRQVQ